MERNRILRYAGALLTVAVLAASGQASATILSNSFVSPPLPQEKFSDTSCDTSFMPTGNLCTREIAAPDIRVRYSLFSEVPRLSHRFHYNTRLSLGYEGGVWERFLTSPPQEDYRSPSPGLGSPPPEDRGGPRTPGSPEPAFPSQMPKNNAGTQRISGKSAGGMIQRWSLWTSAGLVNSDNDLPSTSFESVNKTGLLGGDISPTGNTVLGVAFGIEDSDVTTNFNAGTDDVGGYTVAPYLGVLVSPNFSLTFNGGYTTLDHDQTRTDPITSSTINGDFDSDRWFVSGNLNALTMVSNWVFSGHVGVFYAEEDIDGFTETSPGAAPTATTVPSQSVELGQFQVGGEIAYSAPSFEPYVNLSYEHDFDHPDLTVAAGQQQPANDDSGFRVGIGFRFFTASALSGAFEYSRVEGREDFDSHAVSLIGRLEF